MAIFFSGVDIASDGSPLPISQGGTGATTASGALTNLLPDQTGNTNKVLTTDGTEVFWGTAGSGGGATPAGIDTQVQYNMDGSLAASAAFTFDPVTETLSSTNIIGAGSGITDIDAGNISTGIISPNRLGTGTPTSGTFLAGDGSWAIVNTGADPAGSDTEIQFNNQGTFGASPLFTFNSASGLLAAPYFSGNGSGITSIDAANISTGVISVDRLGAGSASSTTYLRGDGNWSPVTVEFGNIQDGEYIAETIVDEIISGNWTFDNPVVGASPTASNHFTTKSYVDSIASGIKPHASVQVVSTTNLSSLSGLQTIDGYTASLNDRILVAGQTSAADNGVYVASSASWTRAADFDNSNDIQSGDFFFVENGNVYGATGWVLITPGTITIGITPIEFSQMSSNANGGTVSSVSVSGGSTGLTTTGGPITSSGTITLTGTLNVANGGTGNTDTPLAGSVVYGNGIKQLYTTAGTSGQFLASNGTGAPTWTSSGANLTNLNASNLSTGTVATARLGSGTASSSTYLRGDGTWAAVTPSYLNGTTNFGNPSTTVSGLYAGLSLGSSNWPTVQFINSAAASDQKIWLAYGSSDGSFNISSSTDARSGLTSAIKIARSGNSSSLITLTSAGLNFAVGTGGLQLNGSTGTAGQVLTSNGSGSAPTWQSTQTPTTLAATGTMPSSSARGVFSGIQSSFPMLKFYQSTATSTNQTLISYLDASGNLKIAFDSGSGSTNFFTATRSGATATDITLTSTALNLAVGTGGLKLNGSAGTAGQVLMSNGASAAPTWGSVNVTSLQGTSSASPTSATTGTYVGTQSSTPYVFMINSSAPTNTKVMRHLVNSTGSYLMTFQPDSLSSESAFFTATRTTGAVTASLITLTGTSINLAVGTGGLKLNNSAGTAGQVLTSNGASAAPTWTTPTLSNISGGSAGKVLYQSAADTTSFTAVGTAGQVLTSNGTSAPTWTSLPSNVATATSISGGSAGQIPYQTSASATAFIATGTAGQVLTSNGTSAPSWQSAPAASSLTGTSSTTPSGAVTGVYVGANSSLPVIYMTNSAATAGNRALRSTITSAGQFKMTLLTDNLATETSFLAVDRSGNTATLITLTGTSINLAVGTGGLKLNGSAGTAGQVLMSNGASAAPTWQSVSADASNLSGTTLSSSVVSSSLTSVGTLSSLNVSGQASLTGSAAITQYTEHKSTLTASTTTTTIDCSLSNNTVITLSANITTLAFTNVPSSSVVYNHTLILVQDATGGRTVNFPSSVKWANGTPPSLTLEATKIDVITLMTYDGGTSWIGFVAGQNY